MHELDKQRSILAMRRRLSERDKLSRAQMRLSCIGAADAEFQELLDRIVSEGNAERVTGAKGGEWFRAVSR